MVFGKICYNRKVSQIRLMLHQYGVNMSVYAVIHSGGKQYRVSPGDVVQVEKLVAQPGETIEISRVYFFSHDGQVSTGDPVLRNTHIVAQVQEESRSDKVLVFKRKRRKGFRRSNGHRQSMTSLKITKIVHGGTVFKVEKKKIVEKLAAAAAAAKMARDSMHKTKAENKPKRKPAPEPKPKERIPETASPPPQPEKPLPVAEEPKIETPSPAPEPPKIETPPPMPEPPTTTPEAKADVTEARQSMDETVEQRRAPEIKTAPPAAPAEQTMKREPEVPTVPPPMEPEITLPSVQPAVEHETKRIEPEKTAEPEKSRRWWIIAAIMAALLLLGLLLFNWNTLFPGDGPAVGPRPKTGEPAKEKKRKARPPVRDIETEKTAPVDKPAAPAQPPD